MFKLIYVFAIAGQVHTGQMNQRFLTEPECIVYGRHTEPGVRYWISSNLPGQPYTLRWRCIIDRKLPYE